MQLVQAIAWVRTEVLKDVLLEYEYEILYWRGKEIARQENLTDVERLQNFFVQKGLGILDFHWLDDQRVRVGITNSPLAEHYQKATNTISLECGIVTNAFQQMYQSGANGTARWIVPVDAPPYIEVLITLDNPREI